MTAALMSAAQTLLGTTQFTEMYAMDFARDAFLMSHMGEGNWALARADRPVRLIKRSLGIGGLDDPPTFLFQYETGPVHARVAARPPGRPLPARRLGGRDPRHRRAAGPRDAVRLLPPGDRRASVRRRLAPGRRAASPGPEPGPPGRRLAHVLRDDRHRARDGVGAGGDGTGRQSSRAPPAATPTRAVAEPLYAATISSVKRAARSDGTRATIDPPNPAPVMRAADAPRP